MERVITMAWRAQNSVRAAIMSAVGAGLVVFGMLFASASIISKQAQLDALEDEHKRVSVDLDRLGRDRRDLEAEVAALREQRDTLTPLALSGLGVKNPEAVAGNAVNVSLTAHGLQYALADTGLERRRFVTLTYYPRDFERDLNENVVLPRLRELGFRLERGATRLSNVETNAIWFGADVHIDDTRLVAYVLLAAGLQIKAVRPFRDPTGPKRHTIEVGADASLRDDKPLSLDDVRLAESFVR